MDSVQVGKAVFVKESYTTLGIEPRTYSYPGRISYHNCVCWFKKNSVSGKRKQFKQCKQCKHCKQCKQCKECSSVKIVYEQRKSSSKRGANTISDCIFSKRGCVQFSF